MKYLPICLSAAFIALVSQARAEDPAIVAKARAYLGSEADLDGVKSVHMVGHMTTTPEDPAKPSKVSVEIIFQKPWQESILVIQPDRIIRTALDGYEAWQQEQVGVVPGQTTIDTRKVWKLSLLGPDQVKILRIDVLENLWFYHGVLRAGGQIESRGPSKQDGAAVEKVAFVYSPSVVYIRYFDQATGRLVFSESEGGTKIREQGEIKAGGIRFPKEIDLTETIDGKPSSKAYVFDTITVNESFPASNFAVPDLPEPVRPAVASGAAPAKP
jgi:hypothetical protein